MLHYKLNYQSLRLSESNCLYVFKYLSISSSKVSYHVFTFYVKSEGLTCVLLRFKRLVYCPNNNVTFLYTLIYTKNKNKKKIKKIKMILNFYARNVLYVVKCVGILSLNCFRRKRCSHTTPRIPRKPIS